MNKLRLTIAIVAALTALALPTAAFANSGQDGYGGPNSAVAGINAGGGNGPSNGSSAPAAAVVEEAPTVESAAVESNGSTLPFTGLDVGYVAAAGLLLLGTGFM